MDAKITLSFDAEVITKAKLYADKNNISVSRLVEFFLSRATDDDFTTLEAYPIADWVKEIMGDKIVYNTKKSINYIDEYYESKFPSLSMLNEPATPYGIKKTKKK